jgi:hypothetical protein
MGIIIEKFMPVIRGTLRGFADVQMTTIRLIIRDVAVHCFDDRWWVSLPGRPMVNPDGSPILNPRSGKPDYFNLVRFDTRIAHHQFEQQTLDALCQSNPEVFADTGVTP